VLLIVPKEEHHLRTAVAELTFQFKHL
jgi:hypothetical protein